MAELAPCADCTNSGRDTDVGKLTLNRLCPLERFLRCVEVRVRDALHFLLVTLVFEILDCLGERIGLAVGDDAG